jgi:hypothetical protein
MPGEFSAASFDYYEGSRIFIPGAVCVALFAAVVGTFGLDAPTPGTSLVAALLGTVVAGLLLYWIDAPARSAAYLFNQPHEQLEALALPEGVTVQNAYFYILDTEIPSVIRNRALYMGAIYRIGFELIYLAFLCGVGVVILGTAIPSAGPDRDVAHVQWIFLAGIPAFSVLPTAALVLTMRRLKRGPVQVFQRSWRQLRRPDFVLLASASALVATYAALDRAELAAAGIVISAGVWSWRYFRGHLYRERWRNLEPLAASFVLAWTGVLLCVFAAIELPSASALGPTEAAGWLGIMLFAGATVVSRGHERRLFGSYKSQQTWLEFNRGQVEQALSGPN